MPGFSVDPARIKGEEVSASRRYRLNAQIRIEDSSSRRANMEPGMNAVKPGSRLLSFAAKSSVPLDRFESSYSKGFTTWIPAFKAFGAPHALHRRDDGPLGRFGRGEEKRFALPKNDRNQFAGGPDAASPSNMVPVAAILHILGVDFWRSRLFSKGVATNASADPAVLIVDDEDEVCASLSELFASEGIACLATASPGEARDWIAAKNGLRVLITDVRMPGMTGMDLLRAAGRLRPDLAVIVMTGFPSVENAVSAMKLGALNFYSKPVNFQALLDEARGILASPVPPSGTGSAIVTRDPRMLAILDQAERAAATDAPVVILGESGTGKELFARRLHLLSPRRDNNYLCLNCAALPESLLESELFGHEKGAFTGADSARKGRFELADRGTLFLDEIGDMPAATQAKILRAIEQGVFERLGGESGIRADLRIVAASNKDLRALIAEGVFREDLYYRLAVVTIELPPLRERPDDVPLLVGHYLGEFNRQYGKAIAGVEPEAMDVLSRHNWPGNVRELRNCVQRTAIFRDDGLVSVGDLPEQYRAGIRDPAAGESRREKLRELDRDLIKRTLEECDGVKGRAAERLRIHRKTLYNRMKSLGLGD